MGVRIETVPAIGIFIGFNDTVDYELVIMFLCWIFIFEETTHDNRMD